MKPQDTADQSAFAWHLKQLFDGLAGMTARPFVELTIPPREGELESWGKDPARSVVGLVTWYEDVVQMKQMGRSTVLPVQGGSRRGISA
jgi:hypothetical protein